jgi:ADP-ribose diphosphatase
MDQPRNAKIHSIITRFNDFFQINEIDVSHRQRDGSMSRQHRLVFERGDSVAVLLLNRDTRHVILVNQFKVPSLIGRLRDDATATDGWILETIAGMIDPGETPNQAAKRETEEESGYRVTNLEPICTFFSSPGGTSERVFLYFAEVSGADRDGKGGGLAGEDITVVDMKVNELFERLDRHALDDPKLIIAAYWLRDRLTKEAESELLIEKVKLAMHDSLERLKQGSIKDAKLLDVAFWLWEHPEALRRERSNVEGAISASRPAAAPATAELPPSTVRYSFKEKPDCIVGYKTGSIDKIKGVSLWVNSENTDMMMDRFLGRSVSAKIRYLGANRDRDDNVVEDTIEEALRSAVGQRTHVKIGYVVSTESGSLKASHGVQRILHVATVEGGPGSGVKADLTKLAHCVERVLARAEEENCKFWRIRPPDQSIAFPLLGAGDGGLPTDQVVPAIVPPAIGHFRSVPQPTVKEIYYLAYRQRDKEEIEKVLAPYCADGTLVRSETLR